MRQPCYFLAFLLAHALIFSRPAQAAPFKLPAYQQLKTSNGISVFMMQQDEVPLLHISIGVQGGSALDQPALSGLAAMTVGGLELGTKSYKKADLETRLDFLGAELELGAKADALTVDLSLASKDAAVLLPLLGEVVMAPTFPQGDFLKAKARYISELKKRRESPNQLADAYFNKLIFGQHPYGRPVSGSPLSASRVTRNEVVDFYSRVFRPERMAISVVGSFDPKVMEKLIQDTFGTWQITAPPPSLDIPALAPSEAKPLVLLVNKSDATETTFRIGGPGVPRSSPDWTALQVINTILGGRFTSWLNDELRVKTGLTYGARSRFDAMKHTGTFALSSFTANENSFKAIDLAIATYQRFIKEGFTQEMLDSAKAYVKGQFPPRYETLDSLASLLIDKWIYGLPDALIDRFEADVDALTLERSRTLVKSYYPQKLDVLLIGKASLLRSGAEKYGRVIQTEMERIEDGSVPGLDR